MEDFNSLTQDILAFQKDHCHQNIFDNYRDQAFENLKRIGVPTRKTESWKYTNINHLFNNSIEFKSLTNETSLKNIKLDGFTNLIFVNSKLSKSSDATDLKINPLNEKSLIILEANKEGLQNDFASNLNYSVLENGYHFELEANRTLEKPIALIHIHNSDNNTFFANLNTFHIKENSKLEIIEIYISEKSANSFINYATDIKLEKNAIFNHIQHQAVNDTISFFSNVRSQVCADAFYQNFNITLGSKLARNNIHIDLNEPGANCCAHGTYTLLDEQHSDVNSKINHKAAHTQSSQLYKGIMGGKSRGVFTGLIKVNKDAQLINSNQLNKNLILSKGAHANSRPQLEIFADDVKCSHGSTTGQLSDDELFYFLSRGIRAHKARQMLSHAFTYDVLLKIENKLIRNYVKKEILNKFETKAFRD